MENDNPADTSTADTGEDTHDELSDFELKMVAAGSPTNCVGGASSRV